MSSISFINNLLLLKKRKKKSNLFLSLHNPNMASRNSPLPLQIPFVIFEAQRKISFNFSNNSPTNVNTRVLTILERFSINLSRQ